MRLKLMHSLRRTHEFYRECSSPDLARTTRLCSTAFTIILKAKEIGAAPLWVTRTRQGSHRQHRHLRAASQRGNAPLPAHAHQRKVGPYRVQSVNHQAQDDEVDTMLDSDHVQLTVLLRSSGL